MIAVAELDRDLRHLEAERLGDDDRHDGAVGGADVLRAAAHHDAAVGGDLAMRARAGAGAAPAIRRAAQAALDRSGRRIAGHVTALPVDPLRAHRKVLRPHRVWRERRQVLQPELHRIHPHLIGELVHQHFGDEAPLRMSRRAHRALLSGVDVDVGVRAAAIREDIDVRQRVIRSRARAAGAPRLRFERGELAVGARRRPSPSQTPRDDCRWRDALPCDRASSSPARRRPSRSARTTGPGCRDRTCCRTRRP